jgi:hypothetical protein
VFEPRVAADWHHSIPAFVFNLRIVAAEPIAVAVLEDDFQSECRGLWVAVDIAEDE